MMWHQPEDYTREADMERDQQHPTGYVPDSDDQAVDNTWGHPRWYQQHPADYHAIVNDADMWYDLNQPAGCDEVPEEQDAD
eukprot:1049124-Pyramimonas_sp.AAC.1